MENNLEKELRQKAFEYGKKQIERRSFSLPEVETDFRNLVNTNNITKENNEELLEKLNKSFVEGQKFAIQNKYKEALKILPEDIIKKYGNSIDYNDEQDEFENFYELDSKLQIVKKIPEIENINSGIKVLVLWSESSVFKDNQVMSIEQFKVDCDLALKNLRAEREKLGLSGGYDKTKYILIFDPGMGEVGTTNAIRYDIGDFQNFEEYLNRGFCNKNIPRFVQRYLGLEEIKDEEEEVQ